jgi:hypothetical protein
MDESESEYEGSLDMFASDDEVDPVAVVNAILEPQESEVTSEESSGSLFINLQCLRAVIKHIY